jgi:hypothetical protein
MITINEFLYKALLLSQYHPIAAEPDHKKRIGMAVSISNRNRLPTWFDLVPYSTIPLLTGAFFATDLYTAIPCVIGAFAILFLYTISIQINKILKTTILMYLLELIRRDIIIATLRGVMVKDQPEEYVIELDKYYVDVLVTISDIMETELKDKIKYT